MSTTEAEARAEAALRDYDYARISRVTVDPHRLAEALRALLAASRRGPSAPVDDLFAAFREPSARELRECTICGEQVTISNATPEWEKRHKHDSPEPVQGDAKLLQNSELSATDEREWEYGYKLIESDTRDVIDLGWPYKTAVAAAIVGEERAEEESEVSPDMPRVDFCVVRRHEAGAWEVVPE